MNKYAGLVACLLTFACSSASFGAVVLIGDDFESYTIGSTPTNPNDGNANNWFFSGLSQNQVVSGSSPNGEAPNEKLLHVEGTSSSSFGRQFAMQDGAATPNLTLSLSFKLQIQNLTGNDYTIRLMDNTLTSNNIPISFRIASNGSVIMLTRETGPGTGKAVNVNNPQGSQLTTDSWYQFTVNADLTAQTYSVDIMNMETGASGSTDALYFYQNIHTLNALTFSSTTALVPGVNWNLNDVNLTAVPEPGTAMTFVSGVLIVWLGRKSFLHSPPKGGDQTLVSKTATKM